VRFFPNTFPPAESSGSANGTIHPTHSVRKRSIERILHARLDEPEVGIDQPAHFMDMVGKIEAVTAVAGDDDNHMLLLNWFNKFILEYGGERVSLLA
jgi:hypothetical protein